MRISTRCLVASTLLAATTGAGCKSEPACHPGIVLGERCYDGVLIQVDEQYRIGSSIQPYTAPDSLGSCHRY